MEKAYTVGVYNQKEWSRAGWTNKDTYNANKNLVHLDGDLWEEFIGIETPDALRRFYRKAKRETTIHSLGVNHVFRQEVTQKNVNWQEIFESHCEAAVTTKTKETR